MKRLTSSTFSFENVINYNFLYVDKTKFIWQLISPPKGVYFLSRPRQFGKSLELFAIKNIFQGKKELFKGLSIYDKPYDWTPHPIIHLSLLAGDYTSLEQTLRSLSFNVCRAAQEYGISLDRDAPPDQLLQELISKLSTRGKVVILIDEYNRPLLNNIREPYAQEIACVLKSFYSQIKAADSMVRFVFITGISKSAYNSIFADFDNLTDISMDPEYATMFGYTQKEFEVYFAEYIDKAVQNLNVSRDDLLSKMKHWYGGFQFCDKAEAVYCPISVVRYLDTSSPSFKDYWYVTASPKLLFKYCKETLFDFEQALNDDIPERYFDNYELAPADPLALFIQTGYFTIKDSFVRGGKTFYHLKFPNYEVQRPFLMSLLSVYTGMFEDEINLIFWELSKQVEKGKVNVFMSLLTKFLSRIHSSVRMQKYYQTIFYALFSWAGTEIEAEASTNEDRINAMISVKKWRFVLALNLRTDSIIELDRITETEFFRTHTRDNKHVMVIGANLDCESGQISDWKSEKRGKSCSLN